MKRYIAFAPPYAGSSFNVPSCVFRPLLLFLCAHIALAAYISRVIMSVNSAVFKRWLHINIYGAFLIFSFKGRYALTLFIHCSNFIHTISVKYILKRNDSNFPILIKSETNMNLEFALDCWKLNHKTESDYISVWEHARFPLIRSHPAVPYENQIDSYRSRKNPQSTHVNIYATR